MAGVHEHTHIKEFKTRAGFATDKWLQVITIAMLFTRE